MVNYKEGLFLLVQKIINDGVKSVAIIQSPDYSGGHTQSLCFSSDDDEDWWENLPDFTYVEWSGRPIDLLIESPWLNNHVEPFHEEPRDYEWPWWDDVRFETEA